MQKTIQLIDEKIKMYQEEIDVVGRWTDANYAKFGKRMVGTLKEIKSLLIKEMKEAK